MDIHNRKPSHLPTNPQDGRTALLCCANGEGALDCAKLLLEAKCNTAAGWAKKNNLTVLVVKERCTSMMMYRASVEC